jgi:hypothetical protein
MPYFRAPFRQSIGSHSVVDKYFYPPSGVIVTIRFSGFRLPLSGLSGIWRELDTTKMSSWRASILAVSYVSLYLLQEGVQSNLLH